MASTPADLKFGKVLSWNGRFGWIRADELSGDPQMDDSEGGVPPAARQGLFESLYKDFERPSKNM